MPCARASRGPSGARRPRRASAPRPPRRRRRPPRPRPAKSPRGGRPADRITDRAWAARRFPRAGRRTQRKVLEPMLDDAPRAKMLHKVRPMLATLVDRPFDRPGWIFEPKWDGYRAIAEVSRGNVRLYSRNHVSFEAKFAPVVRALEALGHEAVLDGEVVAVDEAGQSQFQLLQNYQKTGEGRLLYYVFDLLFLDGHDLRRLPLSRRKELLAEVVGGSGVVRLSEHVEER